MDSGKHFFTTPDLCDAHETSVAVLDPVFKHYGGRVKFSGQIQTLKCFEDNSLVKRQVSEPGLGRVLVIDGGGSLRRALLGDMLAEQAVANQWAGLVIYGCIRDVEIIETLPLGVMALNTCPIKTEKKGIGELGIMLRFAGHSISPNQYLYADKNGIVIANTALT